jgi:hypothetical protein
MKHNISFFFLFKAEMINCVITYIKCIIYKRFHNMSLLKRFPFTNKEEKARI